MTNLKDQQETAVGTDFVSWYNDREGTHYVFDRKEVKCRRYSRQSRSASDLLDVSSSFRYTITL